MGHEGTAEAPVEPRWYDYVHLVFLAVVGLLIAVTIPVAFFWSLVALSAGPAYRRFGAGLLRAVDRATGVPDDL